MGHEPTLGASLRRGVDGTHRRHHVERFERSRNARHAGGWWHHVAHRPGDAKRERLHVSGRRQAIAGQCAAFRRPGEECRAHAHEAFERGDRPALPFAVEVDQHVAEEHEVERAQPIDQRGIEQIARVPAHLCAQRPDDAIAVVIRREIAFAKRQRFGRAAKRVATVAPLTREGKSTFTDIERVDGEIAGTEPRVEHRHGHRVGFLARGTRQAQQPQRLAFTHRAASRGPFVARQLPQHRERLAMPEEPCLGHDDRFDQRLKLLRRLLQPLPVLRIGGCVLHLGWERGKPRAHGTLDGMCPERLRVEPHGLAQQAFDVVDTAHDDASGVSANASRAASKSSARASSVSS